MLAKEFQAGQAFFNQPLREMFIHHGFQSVRNPPTMLDRFHCGFFEGQGEKKKKYQRGMSLFQHDTVVFEREASMIFRGLHVSIISRNRGIRNIINCIARMPEYIGSTSKVIIACS